jgi:FlaA1/EpsC-like NDP-sugar epimerase
VDSLVERREGPDEAARPWGAQLDGTTVRRAAPAWLHKHVQLLAILDALAAAAATLASKGLAFGLGSAADLHVRSVHVPYVAFIVVSVPTWLAVLASSRCYDVGPFGTGNGEARRVVSAGAHFVAVMAVAYYLLHIQNLGRAFLAAIVPFAIGFTLLGRLLARYRLRLQRARGHATRRAIVMGLPRNTGLLLEHLAAHPYDGIAPVLVAVPGGEAELPDTTRPADVPVTEALDGVPGVLQALTTTGADLLIVTGGMTGSDLRKLTWRLEGSGVAVMVAPSVAGLAGPQLDVRPVAGLPLLYVDHASLGLAPISTAPPTVPAPAPTAPDTLVGPRRNGTSRTNGTNGSL